MNATRTSYKNEGYDEKRQGYVIWEYEGGTPVYQYVGYERGNTMTLYPHHAIVKGTQRGKLRISIREIEA